jgi:hypothetical protein
MSFANDFFEYAGRQELLDQIKFLLEQQEHDRKEMSKLRHQVMELELVVLEKELND